MTALRERAAHALESGSLPRGFALESLAGTLATAALARPLAVEGDAVVVTVGGATIGGSGRTRVALAIARHLEAGGARVALIGHGYRARVRRARAVSATDDLDVVGDEALACARALEGTRAAVFVGPDRGAAARCAVRAGHGVLVIDGPLQTSPRRADLAVLALDARDPWSSGRVLPFGDLRASPDALLAAADEVVHVDAAPSSAHACAGPVGLFTALARPSRLREGLARVGVVPAAVVSTLDHGPSARALPALAARVRGAERDHDLAAWLATPKCALHLQRLEPRRPIVVLDETVALPASLGARLASLSAPGKGGAKRTRAHMG